MCPSTFSCFLALSLSQLANPKTPVFVMPLHTGEVTTVAFAADGKTIASVSHREVKLWDAATGKEIRSIPITGANVYGLAISPDSKTIAVGVSKDVRLFDAETGKEKTILRGGAPFLFRLNFLADGKHLAAAGGQNQAGQQGQILVWDIATGKIVRTLEGHPEAGLNVVGSRDGRLIASCCGATSGIKAGDVRIWEASTGRVLRALTGHANNVYGVALSPDGRRVASASGSRSGAGPGELKVWEVLSGKEIFAVQTHGNTAYNVVFSPDGRRMATCGADKMLRVWDVHGGKEIFGVEAHTTHVFSLAFSPDGKRVVTGGQDRGVKVFELPPAPPRPAPVALKEAQLDAHWQALCGDDAIRASQASWDLTAAGEQAVTHIARHVQPVPGLAAEQKETVAKLLKDLEHRRFTVRDQAARDLQKLGESVLPLLRDALMKKPALDVERKLAELVEALSNPPLTTTYLQERRAIEVLEHCRVPGAKQLLEKLAGGLPGARLTEDARASLERWKANGVAEEKK